MNCSRLVAVAVIAVMAVGCSSTPKNDTHPQTKRDLLVVTTTSTQDSGLLDVLIPQFEKETGIVIKLLAVGSGEALAMGERGVVDAILSHAPASEQALEEKGAVINRHLVMHNDFVLVGPVGDPAGIRGTKTASEAFRRLAQGQVTFVSRGDDSGTHKKEQEIWNMIGVKPQGTWYLESGTGMGKTLLIASDKNGYTLTDRATYLSQQKNLHLEMVLEGDKPLLNVYHVMQVNPAKGAKVYAAGAEAFVTFMLQKSTQDTIDTFGVAQYGQRLFVADAKG